MKQMKKNYKPGNSLRVWKIFQQHRLYTGIDVKEDAKSEPTSKQNCWIAHSSNGNIIKEKYGDNFDIILDDGLHSRSTS